MLQKLNIATLILTILVMILMNGCSDERATQIAREAADRQAQQNTAMAELVEAEAQTRKEFVGVHRELQSERTRLDTGWDSLEQERKHIAAQRRTESLLVPVTTLAGGILLVALVLGFCWYALMAVGRGDGADAQLNELLICEILPDEPQLLTFGRQPATLIGQSDEPLAE